MADASTFPASKEKELRPLGVPRRALLTAAAGMLMLFVLTTFLSNWYEHERMNRARRYFERGSRLAQRGHSAEAIEQYRNALAISRDNSEYRLAVALALIQQGKRDEAAVYLHELLEADPSDALPNLMLARIAAGEGRAQPAVDFYNRAIYGRWDKEPMQRRLEVRQELVNLLAKTGSRKRVVAELLQIAEENPRASVKRWVAQMLLRYGSPTQSADIFRDLLRGGDHVPEVYAGLGAAQLALGKYQDARRSLSRVLRSDPNNEAVRKELALTNEILRLDPTLRGLSAAEEYARTRNVLQQTVAAVEQCAARPGEPAAALMERAREALAVRRVRDKGEAAQELASLAGELWAAREAQCGAPPESLDALSRVVARLSQ